MKTEFTLTTNHAASSYGQPVLVDMTGIAHGQTGEAYGPADIISTGETAKAFVQRWLAGGMRMEKRGHENAPEYVETLNVDTEDPLALEEQDGMMRDFIR